MTREFFPVAELCALLRVHRKAPLRALLDRQRVPYVLDAHGWPLVYRDRLLPDGSPEAARPRFDFRRALAR